MNATAAKSLAGRAQRARGLCLEDDLDAYHATLAASGLAQMRRVGTPHDILGRHGVGRPVFRVVYVGRQGCDFAGYVRPLGGAAVPAILEAKSHAEPDSWSIHAIDDAQRAELDTYQRDGGVALVVLRAWGSHFLFRWAALSAHRVATGRFTVRPHEAASLGAQIQHVKWFGALSEVL